MCTCKTGGAIVGGIVLLKLEVRFEIQMELEVQLDSRFWCIEEVWCVCKSGAQVGEVLTLRSARFWLRLARSIEEIR
ncbi:hypothetical protein ACOSQ2_011734 [Xanthoceras sorbifolium]